MKCIASSAPYLASGGSDDLLHIYDLQVSSKFYYAAVHCHSLSCQRHETVTLTLTMMQAGTDLGFLMNPGDGAVSAITFYAQSASHHPSHLLSGAADGGITVWQAGGEWVCLKTLRGHKCASLPCSCSMQCSYKALICHPAYHVSKMSFIQ